MIDEWSEFFRHRLDQRAAEGLRRSRGSALDDDFVDFGSNDYLGLRSHPLVLSALGQQAALGSGASPVLTGHTRHHAELESSIADLNGAEDALVFSSGFACHSGVIASLAGSGDLILSDQLNHASLIDGCRVSKAQVHIFPHNDFAAAEKYLAEHRQRFGRALLVTESVFSMDGDCAPLTELSELCQRFELGLVVDEAHALGVFGQRGSGLIEELGLDQKPLAKLGTLSKAAGVIGGYVCGSRLLIDYLVNSCRSYIYSTAPPIPIVSACVRSLELIRDMELERKQLRETSSQLRCRLRELGWDVCDGESPIVPIVVGAADSAVAIGQQLLEKRLHVPAIRPPTVPSGTSRLRVSLSVKHTKEQLEQLIDGLAAIEK